MADNVLELHDSKLQAGPGSHAKWRSQRLMSVRWRERLGGMRYAWSVECPLIRWAVTAAGRS
jgi:hypothetical protein